MKPALLVATLALVSCASPPHGWPLAYSQDFDDARAAADFEFTDANAWRVTTLGGETCLEQFEQSRYEPPHRSPLNLAILREPIVGDFLLEARLQQTGRDYPHRDMVVVFGYRDPAHFAYAHLATAADDAAHQLQLVDAAPRRPITTARTTGVDWGRDTWRTVRVERIGERVRVWFDNAPEPALECDALTLPPGRIGFGTFDDTGAVDSIRVRAPSSR